MRVWDSVQGERMERGVCHVCGSGGVERVVLGFVCGACGHRNMIVPGPRIYCKKCEPSTQTMRWR